MEKVKIEEYIIIDKWIDPIGAFHETNGSAPTGDVIKKKLGWPRRIETRHK